MESKYPEMSPKPWWKFGHVWMVLAGPLLVVIAGFITLYLAIRMPDPLVSEDYDRKGMEINKTLGADPSSLLPAVQARNHAATSTLPISQTTKKP
jgi:uncharacterized protein